MWVATRKCQYASANSCMLWDGLHYMIVFSEEMERAKRIELSTSTLARWRSTAELRPLIVHDSVEEFPPKAEANIDICSDFASTNSYL